MSWGTQPPRAEPLVALLKEKTKAKSELVVWPHSFRVPEGADIVINATVDGRLDLDVASLQNRKEQPNCALLKTRQTCRRVVATRTVARGELASRR